MYEFVDTIDHSSGNVLPSEAMKFNGEYLENLIGGYSTLYVKGREALNPEIETGTVGIRDGAYLKNKRFPARVLTIGFQLLGGSNEEFRQKFNILNDILNTEDAELIFNDEPDKYFVGTPQGFGEIPEGRNNITGEFEIMCADPFKYSIEEYEVLPSADDGATFIVDYKGTYPAYPTLEADFYQSSSQDNTDGECGYVAFANDRGNILQFGDPAEPDEIAQKVNVLLNTTNKVYYSSKRLVTEAFDSTSGWAVNNGFTTMAEYVKVGSVKSALVYPSGTDRAVMANSYGSTANPQWHGPTVMKTIPSDGGNPAVSGAKDWRLHALLRFHAHLDSKLAKKELGDFQLFVLDSSNKFICGVQIWKNGGGTKGKIRVYVRGANSKAVAGISNAVKQWTDVDFSYYNARFGLKKKSTDKRPLNIDITKKGSQFTFDIGGLKFTCNYSAYTNTVANKVSMYFAQWGASPALQANAVYSLTFTSDSVAKTVTTETWQQLTNMVDINNTFGTNDVLIAECESGTIRLKDSTSTEEQSGGEHPELGALGNDWEKFTLQSGVNQITTMYSDWVEDKFKPTFKLRYRERYL